MKVLDVKKCPECGVVVCLEDDYYSCANCNWIVHKDVATKVCFTKLDMLNFAKFYEEKCYANKSNSVTEEFNSWLKGAQKKQEQCDDKQVSKS
jgi:acetyl-CoA carboxylase beta subunit